MPMTGAVALAPALCETDASPCRQTMKKTGSNMPSPEDPPGGSEDSAEIIERTQLQAEVAQQRVRLAKEELRRARKRLKEAKREAKRARKQAASTRKEWKRAQRKGKKESTAKKAPAEKAVVVAQRGKSRVKSAAAGVRRAPTKRSAGKRGGNRTRARSGK
jgi:hypothetical protein